MISSLSLQRLLPHLCSSFLLAFFLLSPINASANDADSYELNEAIKNAVVKQLSQREEDVPPTSDNQTQTQANPDSEETSEPEVQEASSPATEEKDNLKESRDLQANKSNKSDADSTEAETKPVVVKKRPRKARNTLTREERDTADYIMQQSRNSNQPKPSGASGWIYLGAYKKQAWEKKTLHVKNTLPKIGSTYALKFALNMRETYPVKDSTSKLLKSLKKDSGVKILNVHPSGKNGHYWALVQPIQMPRGRSRY